MSDACERWAEIGDRRLLGEAISEEDQDFASEHEATCALCRAESRAWASLGSAEELPKPEADALVERAISIAHEKNTEAKKLPLRSLDDERKKRSPGLALAVAAALALAAGTLLLLRTPAAPRGPAVARLSSATGLVRVDGALAEAGAELAAGAHVVVGVGARACIEFDSVKIRSCLDSGSALSIANASARSLSLEKGMVVTALDKLPPGESFSVDAGAATVMVTGTVFSVSTEAVRVHEGSVRIAPKNADAVALGAGRMFDLQSRAETSVTAGDRAYDLEIIGIEIPHAEHTSPPPVESAPVEPAPPASAEPTTESSAKPPSAAEMLEAARKLRAEGNANGAADAYRRLILAHPKSAESHAALISLAELQLGPLADPAGALRSYDTYLHSGGGALTSEARYGRISALRRLGRAAEERAAIEEFVNAYPSSVQARALKARLGEGADAAP